MTDITDTADTTNLTLAAEATEVEGGQITYTATLDNPADTAMTVNLSNGAVITIAAGASFGTVDVNAQGDDVYIDAAETSATITSTSGGNFENLLLTQLLLPLLWLIPLTILPSAWRLPALWQKADRSPIPLLSTTPPTAI